jgi:hypothetical protein
MTVAGLAGWLRLIIWLGLTGIWALVSVIVLRLPTGWPGRGDAGRAALPDGSRWLWRCAWRLRSEFCISVLQLRCRLCGRQRFRLSSWVQRMQGSKLQRAARARFGGARLAAGGDPGRPWPGEAAWPDPVGSIAGGSRNETIKEDHRSAGNHLSGRRDRCLRRSGWRKMRDSNSRWVAPNTLFQQG